MSNGAVLGLLRSPRFYFLYVPGFLVLLLLIRIMMPWTPKSLKHLMVAHAGTLNVGHRGAAGLAPENTLLAFQAAEKAGAQGVEFDVMTTADHKLVVFHDHKLEKRLKDKKGKVRKLTLAQLNKVLDLSAYFKMRNPKKNVPAIFKKATIPTLEEVFDFYKKHPGVVLNVELKNKDVSDRGDEKRIAALIKRYGFEKRVVASSFNPFAVRRFRLVAPDVPVGLIYAHKNVPIYIRQRWFFWLAQPDAIHPDYRIVDADFMKWARGKGFAVNVWTVNQPEDMRRMLKLGVDMIITDHPDLLAKIKKEKPSQR